MQNTGTFQNYAVTIRNIATSKGWKIPMKSDWADDYKIPTCLSLIISEASEALEEFREDNKEIFVEELMDVIIRTFNLAYAFDPNFEQVLIDKIKKNAKREYKHGGKRI